jgi:hypothetical protein
VNKCLVDGKVIYQQEQCVSNATKAEVLKIVSSTPTNKIEAVRATEEESKKCLKFAIATIQYKDLQVFV